MSGRRLRMTVSTPTHNSWTDVLASRPWPTRARRTRGRREGGPRATGGGRDDRRVDGGGRVDRLHGQRAVDRPAQEGEARGGDLLGLLRRRRGDDDRPVTFVFNGGPGASSAYLHMGAVGPPGSRFRRTERCRRCRPGSSRTRSRGSRSPIWCSSIRSAPASAASSSDAARTTTARRQEAGRRRRPKEYFGYKRDLESLCEFMGRWLSGTAGGARPCSSPARATAATASAGSCACCRRRPGSGSTAPSSSRRRSSSRRCPRPTTTCSAGSISCRRWRSPPCTMGARGCSPPARRSRTCSARRRRSPPATTRRS